MKKKMLIFDIDGTLLLTGGAGCLAFEKAFFDLFGIRDSWQDVVPDGKTDPVIFQEITEKNLNRQLTSEELQTLSQKYLSYFEGFIRESRSFRIMPGVEELLTCLQQEDACVLGIGTGNYKLSAQAKLKRAAISHYFKFDGTADDSGCRIAIIESAIRRGEACSGEDRDVVVIGDTPYDISAGKKNEAFTIAVATGSHSIDQLSAHGPDLVLEDFLDYQNIVSMIKSL